MKSDRPIRKSRGRPFWLPASTYYFLTIAIALVIFFLVWAVLAEAKEENPWIAAGLIASSAMIAGVVVREVVLRTRRHSIFEAQRRLDNSILSASIPVSRPDAAKLTLAQNANLLAEIERKHQAARVLDRFSESHREVFDLCAQYIEVATRELPNIGVGSPRLAAIKRGRDKAERLHREHMLRWAEIEVKKNTANLEDERTAARLKGAHKALSAVDLALRDYPDDSNLLTTRSAITNFSRSISVTALINRSKGHEDRGDLGDALASLVEARDLIEEDPLMYDQDGNLKMILDGIDRLHADIERR